MLVRMPRHAICVEFRGATSISRELGEFGSQTYRRHMPDVCTLGHCSGCRCDSLLSGEEIVGAGCRRGDVRAGGQRTRGTAIDVLGRAHPGGGFAGGGALVAGSVLVRPKDVG